MARCWWDCMARLIPIAVLFIAASCVSVAEAQAPDEAEWLGAHNAARSAEGVGLAPFTWNTAAYSFAASWAADRAASPSCDGHSGTNTYGENIAWNTDTTASPTLTVNYWMAEKPYYDLGSNTCSLGTYLCGHYTQIVWSTTTSVGCASAICSGGGRKFFICSYYPPGNMDWGRPY